jgi:hydrogenase maturation factor HypE
VKPKFSDSHRFRSAAYTPAKDMTADYLTRKFAEIREKQKAEAERERQEAQRRLKNAIDLKRKAK